MNPRPNPHARPNRNPHPGRDRLSIRLAPDLAAVLRAHAFVRNVSVNKLTNDMLALLAHLITDYAHPYFHPDTLGFPPPPYPDEPRPGYFASLGFGLPSPTPDAPPPSRSHGLHVEGIGSHASADPLDEEDLALVDATPLAPPHPPPHPPPPA
jgi:hypothetical protein